MAKKATKPEDLPLGTTPETERLHTRIRRICYVLLFGLVLEGAFVTLFSLVWFGWPQLSVQQICSGLEQNMYSDKHLQCHSYSLTAAPPFGHVPKDIQDAPKDNTTWGATPNPNNARIGFRQLIPIMHREQSQSSAAKAASPQESAATACGSGAGTGAGRSADRSSAAKKCPAGNT